MLAHIKRLRRAFLLSVINIFSGTHMFGLKRCLCNHAGISVGKGTKIVGPIIMGNSSIVKIGEDCWIGQGLRVYGDGQVEIGNRCDLAPDVAFMTGSHELGHHERRAGKGLSYHIQVGDGCWLGARSSLMGNVRIGDGAVIAACACVNKDVETDTVVGGVPARILRKL